ncbi:type II secretion system protein GspL [Candidatus Symbiopectobacterium sp. 'North America']|uniref:type II secretion system protein GspL n=1 Tax=Candidatus Symbiopectobacterium sp. 'North America' TaxID=2794574 RepID=UPI001FD0647A|nr:type II secretion system protein GspL [Candidatus Symbiopectobacterium sp. 'North America']
MKTFNFQRVFPGRALASSRQTNEGVRASDKPRLAGDESDVEWLIAHGREGRVVTQGQGSVAQLRELLAGYPGIHSATLLVPTTAVAFHSLTIARQARRQLQQALPFMLEERLAVDVETVHCAVLAWDGDRATVAVVAKSKMALCGALSIKPDIILPDVMALPLPVTGLSALCHRDLWLFRHTTGDGMAAEQSWHAALLAVLPQAHPDDEPGAAGNDADQEMPVLHGDSYSHQAPSAGIWASQPNTPGSTGAEVVPVRAGPGGIRTGESMVQRVECLALAGCYLLLLLADAVWQHYQLYQQATYWQQESVRVYRQIFPAETQVVNPRVQMQQHLQQAGGERDTPRLLQSMNRLQALLGENQDIRLTTLAYDGNRQEISLAYSAPAYPELEQFQQQAETYYQIQHGEIRQNGTRVEAQMTLKGQA